METRDCIKKEDVVNYVFTNHFEEILQLMVHTRIDEVKEAIQNEEWS